MGIMCVGELFDLSSLRIALFLHIGVSWFSSKDPILRLASLLRPLLVVEISTLYVSRYSIIHVR